MKLLYYALVYPVSKLPFAGLYLVGRLLYFTLYHLLSYRKTVVRHNLKASFPEKTPSERKQIEQDFYRYLSKMVVESVKNISISKSDLMDRMTVRNPELINDFYAQGKSVLLVGSHFHNWEYLITAQNFLFKHQAVGVGKPLSSGFWDELLTAKRERFGMRVVNAHNLKSRLQEWKNEQLAILLLFDQSPGADQAEFWQLFLNQQTAFLFGTEKMAVAHDLPVIQLDMQESSFGHYEIVLSLITAAPRKEAYGEITRRLISNLESQIVKNPAYWLWSHKRWKKAVPHDLKESREAKKLKHLAWLAQLDETLSV